MELLRIRNFILIFVGNLILLESLVEFWSRFDNYRPGNSDQLTGAKIKKVSVGGIEPPTLCLKGKCSTTELHALNFWSTNIKIWGFNSNEFNN